MKGRRKFGSGQSGGGGVSLLVSQGRRSQERGQSEGRRSQDSGQSVGGGVRIVVSQGEEESG